MLRTVQGPDRLRRREGVVGKEDHKGERLGILVPKLKEEVPGSKLTQSHAWRLIRPNPKP